MTQKRNIYLLTYLAEDKHFGENTAFCCRLSEKVFVVSAGFEMMK